MSSKFMSDRTRRFAGTTISVVLLAIVAYGVLSGAPTPAERLANLGDRIKCPVCEGNSIIDSPHPYAADMVSVVEEMIAAGETDDQILDFFSARYSDSIRLDATAGRAVALWILPVAGLGAGIWLVMGRRRRRDVR